MPKTYQTSEFSEEQLEQIKSINMSAACFIDDLLTRPDYLKHSGLKEATECSVTEAEIVDLVADYLVHKCKCNVFYPTHTELPDGLEWVSDTFNDVEIYEDSYKIKKDGKEFDVHGTLIVKPTVVLNERARQELLDDMVRQKRKTGIVVIPEYCKVVVADKHTFVEI